MALDPGDLGTVIIGAGHAGGTVAALLRQYGYDKPIHLLGSEPYPPYQRPPLSKAWLKGDCGLEDLFLKSDDFYTTHDIDLRLGCTVRRIEPEAKKIWLNETEYLSYEHLIIATGTQLRPFECKGLETVPYHQVYRIDQAQALSKVLTKGARLAIIGTGYIGLEVAATARAKGCEVDVFGRSDRLLNRVASKALADHLLSLHQSHGVRFHFNQIPTTLSLTKDQTIGFDMGPEGQKGLEFDHLVIGIGAIPNAALGLSCGLMGHQALRVDEHGQTSDPHIFAIGDVTSRPLLPHYSGYHHLESVPSALEQAKQVAAFLTNRPPPQVEVPWFWSDQYDQKLQIAGLPQTQCQAITRLDPVDGSFSVAHVDENGHLRALEAVNRPTDFMSAKLLIAKKIPLDLTQLSDPNHSLKTYLRPA